MSNEDWVPPLNCISVSLPYGPAPIQKPNSTIPSITPKFFSPLLGRGGHYDNLISLWEEVLYWMLHESILGPLIFISRGQDVFLSPSVVVLNISAPTTHVFGDILAQCWNHQKLLWNWYWSGLLIMKLKHIRETAIS